MKIGIEKYFEISDFLSSKTKHDFQTYKHLLNKEQTSFDEEDPLKALENYYESEHSSKHRPKIFETILSVQKTVVVLAFLIGFGVNFIHWGDRVNIVYYGFFSLFLPLAYLLYLLVLHFRYNFPSKVENSLLQRYLQKRFKEYSMEHSHVIKTYSTMIFVQLGIAYFLGILLSTVLVFSATNVTFYSGSTYKANDWGKTVLTPSKTAEKNDSNTSAPDTKASLPYTYYSSALLSRIITAALALMLFMKIVLYFLAKRNNEKTIRQALLKQAESFFTALKTDAQIGFYTPNETTRKTAKSSKTEKKQTFFKTYSIMYYEIDPEDAQKIQTDIADDEILKNKERKGEYFFALLDNEEEDEEILQKLEGLVLLYPSAETLPDEAFKRKMLDILRRGRYVTNIWIVPLKDEEDRFRALKKNDKDYKKWESLVAGIGHKNIRIYYDLF